MSCPKIQWILAASAALGLTMSAADAAPSSPTSLKQNVRSDVYSDNSAQKTWDARLSDDDDEDVEFIDIDTSADGQTVGSILVTNPSFKILRKLLLDADLLSQLESSPNITLFAPSDAAFNKLPPQKLNELKANKEKLKQVLSYHVVPKKLAANAASNGRQATLSNGKEVRVEVSNGKVTKVNDAKVKSDSTNASNGVVYEIDTVLIPLP